MRWKLQMTAYILLAGALSACGVLAPASQTGSDPGDERPAGSGDVQRPSSEPTPTLDPGSAGQLLTPDDLIYIGAFRLPPDPEGQGWEYGGGALAYYPDGDPGGPDDGYPGSLFGMGHDWFTYVAEIAIPAPVAADTLDALPVAPVLQDFQDIRGDLYRHLDFEIPRTCLEYLPSPTDPTGGQLHFCWGQHYQDVRGPSHGWANLDLSNPDSQGAWFIGGYSNYSTNDYLFAIPTAWSDLHIGGMPLATGRFRDGGWSGQGPSLVAYDPGVADDPPPPGTELPAIPLLLYNDSYEPGGYTMTGYHHSDEWSGGAWLTSGDKSAVIFVGTKGIGEYWYGFANGVVWPDQAPYPPIPPPPNDDRGWWSTRFEAQFIFYNPDDLAAAARGDMESYEPQPYAALNVDDALLGSDAPQRKARLGAAAFDRERGLLYVFELFGDGDLPVVHVWLVSSG